MYRIVHCVVETVHCMEINLPPGVRAFHRFC